MVFGSNSKYHWTIFLKNKIAFLLKERGKCNYSPPQPNPLPIYLPNRQRFSLYINLISAQYFNPLAIAQ